MTDEEWREFRVRYLIQNNIFLSDQQRYLYDAPVRPPDAPGDAQDASAIEKPSLTQIDQDEALIVSVPRREKPTPLEIMLGGMK